DAREVAEVLLPDRPIQPKLAQHVLALSRREAQRLLPEDVVEWVAGRQPWQRKVERQCEPQHQRILDQPAADRRDHRRTAAVRSGKPTAAGGVQSRETEGAMA